MLIVLPFALQIKGVALILTLPYPEEPFSTLFLYLLLQTWSASLLQRALQACLYSSMKNQPVFLKAASRHSENEAVLSLSVYGEGRRREVLVQRLALCTSWSLMLKLFG